MEVIRLQCLAARWPNKTASVFHNFTDNFLAASVLDHCLNFQWMLLDQGNWPQGWAWLVCVHLETLSKLQIHLFYEVFGRDGWCRMRNDTSTIIRFLSKSDFFFQPVAQYSTQLPSQTLLVKTQKRIGYFSVSCSVIHFFSRFPYLSELLDTERLCRLHIFIVNKL